MKKQFFVAGTDTDAGKTFVSVALLEAAKKAGLTTAALKPVAAGCIAQANENGEVMLQNDDALALQQAITENVAYRNINPVALKPAIAPHIAAAQIGTHLSVRELAEVCQPILDHDANLMLVEGAGGWRVPLNASESMADVVKQLNLPVILVVGLKLGCINHALLTAEAIIADGLPVAAWVANQVDPDMAVVDENIATLADRFPFPCLGHIPFLSRSSTIHASEFLNIDKLLEA